MATLTRAASVPPLPPVSWFETMSPFVFYLPLFAYYLYLSLRFRSFTVLGLANPSIPAGGFWGESKQQALHLLGSEAKKFLMPFVCVEVGNDKKKTLQRAIAQMKKSHLAYPIVAKPDIGCRGRAVRIVRSEAELAAYVADFPAGADLILQAYCAHEGEAGVFYVRRPGEAKGSITSITLKYFPSVMGDGVATVAELIERDPRARYFKEAYRERNASKLHYVPALGESFRLVSVGNHCRGAIFRDGTALATEAMHATFDRIAKNIPGFYVGRFDVRFPTLEDLRAGVNISILEFNGIGSEPTHIWDPMGSLTEAYRVVARHLRTSFEIGAINRTRGYSTPSLGLIFALGYHQSRLARRYPPELEGGSVSA